jgi:hypothetical protein
MSLTTSIPTTPGDHIRSMYELIRKDAETTHEKILDKIITAGLSDDTFATLYKKVANDFKTRLIQKSYDIVLYFSLEQLFDYARYAALESKSSFYVLDADGEHINFNEKEHMQRRMPSGGYGQKVQDRWEKYYTNHPKFVAVGEKLATLFPGWKIGKPHMRWYEASGFPYVCFMVSMDLA